jgi:hypothetical protein
MSLNNKGSTIVIVSIIVVSVIMLIAGAYGIFWLYQNYQNKNIPSKVDAAKIEQLDAELFTLLNRDNFATQVDGEIVPKDKESIKDILNKLENNTNEFKKNKINNTTKYFKCTSTRDFSVKLTFIDKIDEMFINKGAYSGKTDLEFWFRQHPAKTAQYYRDYKRDCLTLYEKNGIKLYEMK